MHTSHQHEECRHGVRYYSKNSAFCLECGLGLKEHNDYGEDYPELDAVLAKARIELPEYSPEQLEENWRKLEARILKATNDRLKSEPN